MRVDRVDVQLAKTRGQITLLLRRDGLVFKKQHMVFQQGSQQLFARGIRQGL